jgi:UDP-N-acetylglucosamine 4,6-dehydratase/5-epimerase
MLKNKSLLITGGTGSLGKAITRHICENHSDIHSLVIYSRDEQKQYKMANEFPKEKYPFIHFVIGDVRDRERLNSVSKKINFIIHAAAMKHVPIAELNPTECIKTNVGGAENVISVATENQVSKVIALSTDKACSPINLYGATKLTSDKLFVAADTTKINPNILFSVVRFGNLLGSNDSVIPFFIEKQKEGFLPITNPNMTRFTILIQEAVEMVFYVLEKSWGGEIFVPKIPSFKLKDLAQAINPNIEHKIIGIRQGEKIHEEMISSSDSYNTYDLGKYYSTIPQIPNWNLANYINHFKAKKVAEGFNYTSLNNKYYLSVDELRIMIKNFEK